MRREDKAGVYMIKNKVNGKVYIGSTIHLNRRCREHMHNLQNGLHFNKHLQRSFTHYGSDNFAYEVVLICEPKDRRFFEQRFLDAYWDGGGACYNNSNCARGPRGTKLSDGTRAKMSAKRKGVPFSEAHKKNLALTMVGNKRGVGNSNTKGHNLTEEHKAKLRAASTGKFWPEERKIALSKLRTGKKATEETKRKMSAGITAAWKKRKGAL